MSYDDDATIYTLTTSGWVVSDSYPDGVERWARHVFQASDWSREYITWTCVWANPDVPRPERDRVRKEHREFMGEPGQRRSRETNIGKPL